MSCWNQLKVGQKWSDNKGTIREIVALGPDFVGTKIDNSQHWCKFLWSREEFEKNSAEFVSLVRPKITMFLNVYDNVGPLFTYRFKPAPTKKSKRGSKNMLILNDIKVDHFYSSIYDRIEKVLAIVPDHIISIEYENDTGKPYLNCKPTVWENQEFLNTFNTEFKATVTKWANLYELSIPSFYSTEEQAKAKAQPGCLATVKVEMPDKKWSVK